MMSAQEQALSMTEAKLKLADLKTYMPNADETIYKLGIFLGEYLNDELVPSGFVFGAYLAINDLQTGINGYTGEKIKNSLVGYPAMMYGLMRHSISPIADAVLPAEFANEVKKIINETKK